MVVQSLFADPGLYFCVLSMVSIIVGWDCFAADIDGSLVIVSVLDSPLEVVGISCCFSASSSIGCLFPT